MAEQTGETDLEASAGTKNRKPLLFMTVAVVPIMAILAFFLVTKVINPRFAEADAKASAEAEDNQKQGYVYEIGAVLANPLGMENRRIMKVGVLLELTSKSLIRDVENSKLRLQHQLIMILSSKELDVMTSPEGKSALQDELRDAFTLELGLEPGEIRQIYFSEFVIQ